MDLGRMGFRTLESLWFLGIGPLGVAKGGCGRRAAPRRCNIIYRDPTKGVWCSPDNLSHSIVYIILERGRGILPTNSKGVRMVIRRVVDECGLPQKVLAEDAGLSYAGLRAWLLGHRTPRSETIQKLAAGLRSRSQKLLDLADYLEKSTSEGSSSS